MKVILYVENEYAGAFSPEVKEMTPAMNFVWEEKISKKQGEEIHKVVQHLGSIIDLEKVQNWCVRNHARVMLFGSRTRGHERKDSDLDVMVSPEKRIPIEDIPAYLKEQQAVFRTFLKESISLDFKLNTSDSDYYGGFTYTGMPLPNEGLDFIFYWDDIPSYVDINHNRILFEIEARETVFNGDKFRKIN